MDTLDRPDVNLPARLQPGSSRLPAQIHVASRELAAAAPPSPVNSRLLLRGLVRHWWHILLLWLVVSIPGVYLIHRFVEPSYDASSTLRIEPSPELFGSSAKGDTTTGFGQYLETQRALILSNRVLEPGGREGDSGFRAITRRTFPSSDTPPTPKPTFAGGWASVSSPALSCSTFLSAHPTRPRPLRSSTRWWPPLSSRTRNSTLA